MPANGENQCPVCWKYRARLATRYLYTRYLYNLTKALFAAQLTDGPLGGIAWYEQA